MNNQFIEHYDKSIERLMKKRRKAFLYGWTKRVVSLDRKIAQLELELDDLTMFS